MRNNGNGNGIMTKNMKFGCEWPHFFCFEHANIHAQPTKSKKKKKPKK